MKPALEHLPKEKDNSFVVKFFDYNYYPTPWHYHPEYEIVMVTESTVSDLSVTISLIFTRAISLFWVPISRTHTATMRSIMRRDAPCGQNRSSFILQSLPWEMIF
jgi:hypothetical protein